MAHFTHKVLTKAEKKKKLFAYIFAYSYTTLSQILQLPGMNRVSYDTEKNIPLLYNFNDFELETYAQGGIRVPFAFQFSLGCSLFSLGTTGKEGKRCPQCN
jgi:hypothetical protein